MAQGTGTPKVMVNVTSGNLRRAANVTDGLPGLIGTALTVGLIGVAQRVYSLADAVTKGYSFTAEPHLYRQLQLFYNELGGNMELWVLGVEQTMTLAQMCSATNNLGIKQLINESAGRVTMVGVFRQPGISEVVGSDFLHPDVEAGLLASKNLGIYQQSINRPIRMLIEARVVDVTEPPFEPNTAENGYAGLVLGNARNDGSACVGAALARAVKYPAHVKIGNGQNGPLTLTQAFIGNKKLEKFFPEELDAFADAGYIIPHIRDGLAGYYFGRDNMATKDDFRILVHGRLIDKAQRIVVAQGNPLLETHVRMTREGKINETDAKYLEELYIAQLRANMGDQISDCDVIINTDQDLINTSTSELEVKVQPLGYQTWISVTIGLTSSLEENNG